MLFLEVLIMKKRILLVVAVVVTTCFISCADIFGSNKRDVITVTIPAFSSSSNNGRAANTGSTFSNWNVYAFLVGKNIASENLNLLANAAPGTSGLKDLIGLPGILDAVEYKGVNLAYDTLVRFKRVKSGMECFVYLAITYKESIVFYGWGPGNAVIQQAGLPGSTAPLYSLSALHVVQAGVNNIGLVLKKNSESNVYFYSQEGTTDASGAPTTPQASTPRKPAAAVNSTMSLIEALREGKTTVVLAEDVQLPYDIEIDSTTTSTLLSVPGNTHTLTLAGESLNTKKVEIQGTLWLVDVTLAADIEIKGAAKLALNGNVAIQNSRGNAISFVTAAGTVGTSASYGEIIVAGPLQRNVGTLTFDHDLGFGFPLTYYNNTPIIRDAGSISNPKNFFGVNVVGINAIPTWGQEPFTYEFKRSGNGWNLFITVNP